MDIIGPFADDIGPGAGPGPAPVAVETETGPFWGADEYPFPGPKPFGPGAVGCG